MCLYPCFLVYFVRDFSIFYRLWVYFLSLETTTVTSHHLHFFSLLLLVSGVATIFSSWLPWTRICWRAIIVRLCLTIVHPLNSCSPVDLRNHWLCWYDQYYTGSILPTSYLICAELLFASLPVLPPTPSYYKSRASICKKLYTRWCLFFVPFHVRTLISSAY